VIGDPQAEIMKHLAQALSGLALLGTLLPACLLFAGRISLESVKGWMLVATVAWFIVTPFWMERRAAKQTQADAANGPPSAHP
jgi:hypothetical protein